ncbi:LOW QUALITY PROTEIN: disintegrin and metalloproteinase domain-containing protein 20-like [Perognathus longimembris pacificus]|uniref:LOW QUALITY PROTEIN: disintegrin and metalloproteinase domain-containing protein 20-like n=1 Tax=Perognathus longimembris pacificus TaxID=214514 RepID=UPI002018A508|nr:LOW QUALITY PROTEIN: disintegrin and metalloproteinase domain-containing protein 20-like [Perognathus longimembris pacificus]
MRSSWAQGLLPGALCLPVLWTLLSPACCSNDSPSWRFTSSEVVIPRKVPHSKGGSKTPDQLSYSMRFRGQRHVLHMKRKKNLLPQTFPVITDNTQGGMQEDYPFIPGDCYYYSYLEGVPGSLATLDTCHGGLRGRIQVDDFTYEIKPLETSSKFEHVISMLVAEERGEASQRCVVGEEEIKPVVEDLELSESPRAGTYYLWRRHPKDTRIVYVVAYSYFKHFLNQTLILQQVLIINSIIDSIYKPASFNMNVRLVVFWENEDIVSTNVPRAYDFLRNFSGWVVRTWFDKVTHSAAMLLVGERVKGTHYLSYHGGFCTRYNTAFYVVARNFHVFLVSTLAAHALGHLFGSLHDSPRCVCFRRRQCVMTPLIYFQDTFSNCTFQKLHEWGRKQKKCTWELNVPYESYHYIAPRCGDRIISQMEDCDCGSLKDCASDKCCGTDCFFTKGTQCDSGDCCQDCKFIPAGTVCRDIVGICDLREYCPGNSEKCPNDTYIQDGTPCSPKAVCVGGNCTDRELQCQALFGRNIKEASAECYEQLNTIGDRFGNCGLIRRLGGPVPLPCSKNNVLCGMLHCSGVSALPGGGEHTTFHDLTVRYEKEEHHCFGYDVHFGTEQPEMGLVVDGAMCGAGKYCLKRNCTSFADLGFDCDVKRCNYKGVCNNNHKCHCMPGWRPPTCEEKGQGGSEDSGIPAGKQHRLQTYIHVGMRRIVIVVLSRLVLFLLSIIGGGITAVVAGSFHVKRDEHLKDLGYVFMLKERYDIRGAAESLQPQSALLLASLMGLLMS